MGAYDKDNELIGILKADIIKKRINVKGGSEKVIQIGFLSVKPGFEDLYHIEKYLVMQLYRVLRTADKKFMPVSLDGFSSLSHTYGILVESLMSWGYMPRRPLHKIREIKLWKLDRW